MRNILFIAIALLTFSCDDFTDIQPKGEVLPKNIDGLKGLLNQRYANYGVENTMYMLPEMQVPAGLNLEVRSERTADYIYNFEDHFYESNQGDRDITKAHSELNELNVILDNVDNSNGTVEEIEFVKQTALIRRAHIYYMFLNAYCPSYTEAIANDAEKGWVNKYSENYDADMTRLTLQESYDLVINDLTEAIKITSSRQKYSVYGTTAAANGLMGMVYVSMAKYSEALPFINSALADYSFLYDFNDYALADLPSAFDNKLEFDDEVLMGRQGYTSLSKSVWGTNHAFCSQELIDLFIADDLRSNFLHDNGSAILWYGARDGYYSQSCTVPLMLLYKAECLARTGQVDDAMDAINTLREKRFDRNSDTFWDRTDVDNPVFLQDQWDAVVKLTAADQADALTKIYDESRRELAFTGHSFNNVRRLNANHNAGISLNRKSTETGENLTLPANHAKWTLPIPRYYIDLDPELKQNPRE